MQISALCKVLYTLSLGLETINKHSSLLLYLVLFLLFYSILFYLNELHSNCYLCWSGLVLRSGECKYWVPEPPAYPLPTLEVPWTSTTSSFLFPPKKRLISGLPNLLPPSPLHLLFSFTFFALPPPPSARLSQFLFLFYFSFFIFGVR